MIVVGVNASLGLTSSRSISRPSPKMTAAMTANMTAPFPGALLMQVMPPEVGAAVGAHSVFRTAPWGRLERSVDAVLSWVYEPAAAHLQAGRLRAVHRSIRGIDGRGRAYHALHPGPYA